MAYKPKVIWQSTFQLTLLAIMTYTEFIYIFIGREHFIDTPVRIQHLSVF